MRIESILVGVKLMRPSIESDGSGHYAWVVTVLPPESRDINGGATICRGDCDSTSAAEALEIAAGMASEIATKIAALNDDT